MEHSFDINRFARRPLVGIMRGLATEQVLKAAEVVVAGGIDNLEITLNTPDAGQQIRHLATQLRHRANIGAGTIRTVQDVYDALDAGATYIVTPMVDAKVIAACREASVPVLAGALTPTEIMQAWECGATMIKVFPARSLGAAYFHDLRGPLFDIPLMPTGGITVENLPHFQRSGAAAFGIGSPLFDHARIAAEDWDWLKERSQAFVQSLEAGAADRASEAASLAATIRRRIGG